MMAIRSVAISLRNKQYFTYYAALEKQILNIRLVAPTEMIELFCTEGFPIQAKLVTLIWSLNAEKHSLVNTIGANYMFSKVC